MTFAFLVFSLLIIVINVQIFLFFGIPRIIFLYLDFEDTVSFLFGGPPCTHFVFCFACRDCAIFGGTFLSLLRIGVPLLAFLLNNSMCLLLSPRTCPVGLD